jgi:hypothetical protein
MSYKLSVSMIGNPTPLCINDLRFPSYNDAHWYGLDLYDRCALVFSITVLPSTDPVTHIWTSKGLTQISN